MKTSWVRILFVGVFVMTLTAGVVAGLLAARLPIAAPASTPNSTAADSSLAEQLELRSDQREQMRQIWVDVRNLSTESYQNSLRAKQLRDDAIRALIPADKVEEYNRLCRDYSDHCAVLEGRRRAAFDKAVERTNAILSETQRQKYRNILKLRLGPDFDHGHDPMNTPDTAPAPHGQVTS